jgi:uncharacterized protein (DUF1501 family)
MSPIPPGQRLTRRAALLGLAAAVSVGPASLALAAAPTDRRFVVVILRGALDGLAAVVPYGDPDLARWRPELLPPPPGDPAGLLDLGGFFGLNPALAGLHGLYNSGQLLPIHAVAGAWRTRSHFDAQDYLECGADHRMTSGWLNRAVLAIPPGAAPDGRAIAVGVSVPLLLRGPATVGAWAPQTFGAPAPDLYARIVALHDQDPVTGRAITEGLRERGFTAGVMASAPPVEGGRRNAFPSLAAAAARLLAAPDGPRIAALEIGGWDTHADQKGRLKGPLEQLDQGIVALRDGLGEAWGRTVVLVMTEFGRTVRMNGTKGTDHGTGTIAFVAGGAVAGGRIAGAWPGLAQDRLLENRDLMPTTDLRAVAKGLLAQHLHLSAAALRQVFPDSEAARTMPGLLRA